LLSVITATNNITSYYSDERLKQMVA